MDFANGLYYNGTTTSTDPTAFVNNSPTVTAGKGLLCNATNLTAKGALLSAFQGASGYSAQVSTFGAAASAGANVGILTDNNNNGFLNNTDGGFLLWNNGASSGLSDGNGLDWTKGCWGTESITTAIRRMTSLGAGTVAAATGIHAADTNGFASPTSVFLGSWNNAFEFGQTSPPAGYIAQIAVFNGVQLPDAIIPPPGFIRSKGIWWNGDATNFKVSYGNVLQHEYTDPWTFIVAACVLTFPNAGVSGAPDGIFFTNVPTAAQNPGFPGYEFWVNGAGNLHVRIIHNIGTPAYIGKYGSTVIADGLWHVYAATYDGSGLAAGVSMYIDGVLETMTVESDTLGGGSIKDPNNNFEIANQTGLALGLPGAIGLVRQYNRQLSQAEIQNFNINKTIPAIDASCVLAPKFTEGGSSTTTGDDSASALTGTFPSASFWLRI